MPIRATEADSTLQTIAVVRVSGDEDSTTLPPEFDAVYVSEEEDELDLVFTRPALPQLTAFTANLFQARSLITPDATQGNNYAWRDTRWPANPRIDLRFTYTGATSVAFRQYPDYMPDANIPVASSSTTFATASFTPQQRHTRVVATATNAEGSVSMDLHIYYWSPPTLTAAVAAFQTAVGRPPVQTEIVDINLTRGGTPLPAPSTFTMTASDGSATYDLTRHFRVRTGHPAPVLSDMIRLTRAVTGTISNVTYIFTCTNTVPGAARTLGASASVVVAFP